LKPDEQSLAVSVTGGGSVKFSRLDVYELQSAWRLPASRKP